MAENTIRKTPVAARELGISYHQLIGLVRFGTIDPPARDTSGDYAWTDADLARVRAALSRRLSAREAGGAPMIADPAGRLATSSDPAPQDRPADPVAQVRDRPEAAALEPLLVPADQAAPFCGISEATWYRLKAADKLPAPVQLGARVLWRLADLRLWVSWGCPSRREFDARRAAANADGRLR